MRITSSSIALSLSALILVALQGAGNASVIQTVTTNGSITEDGSRYIAVYVTATKIAGSRRTGFSPTVSGQISIAGRSGSLAFGANAIPQTVTFKSGRKRGATYELATITSGVFTYYDLDTGQSQQAWILVDLTSWSTGVEDVGFKIYSATGTGTTLIAQTTTLTSPTVFAQLALANGSQVFGN